MSDSNFRIFSTEKGATVTPDLLNPLPATLIVFDEDPDSANYNPSSGGDDRGSVFKTLGGVVIQDFGVVQADEVISFSASSSLSQSTVNALKTAYGVVNGQWYFTDGYNCWKVQFSRSPRGFKFWRDIFFAAKGKTFYSYQIQLLVISLGV